MLDKCKLTVKKLLNINLCFYASALAIAAAIKILYRQAEDIPGAPGMMLFLKPLSFIVGAFFGISFDFNPSRGFFNDSIGVVIGTSCAGVNFYVIVYCMLVFTFIRLFKPAWQKAAACAIFMAISYVVAIAANTSRIIAAISVLQIKFLSAVFGGELVHQLIGIMIYLIFLILGFYISKIILAKAGSTYEASV